MNHAAKIPVDDDRVVEEMELNAEPGSPVAQAFNRYRQIEGERGDSYGALTQASERIANARHAKDVAKSNRDHLDRHYDQSKVDREDYADKQRRVEFATRKYVEEIELNKPIQERWNVTANIVRKCQEYLFDNRDTKFESYSRKGMA